MSDDFYYIVTVSNQWVDDKFLGGFKTYQDAEYFVQAELYGSPFEKSVSKCGLFTHYTMLDVDIGYLILSIQKVFNKNLNASTDILLDGFNVKVAKDAPVKYKDLLQKLNEAGDAEKIKKELFINYYLNDFLELAHTAKTLTDEESSAGTLVKEWDNMIRLVNKLDQNGFYKEL